MINPIEALEQAFRLDPQEEGRSFVATETPRILGAAANVLSSPSVLTALAAKEAEARESGTTFPLSWVVESKSAEAQKENFTFPEEWTEANETKEPKDHTDSHEMTVQPDGLATIYESAEDAARANLAEVHDRLEAMNPHA